MGGTLHRLEVLMVGLVVLLAGGVAVLATALRVPAQPVYLYATPAPVSAPAPAATSPAPTAARGRTEAPALRDARTEIAGLAQKIALPRLPAAWALLLLAVGASGIGLVVGRRLRRRRMAYTGQSVGMLLSAADPRTREGNLRVLRDLHARGALTHELAVAAGIARRVRLPRLPQLRPAAVIRSALSTARLRLPAVVLPVAPWRRISTPSPALELPPVMPLPMDERGMSVLADPAAEAPAEPVAGEADRAVWTAEDRALAVAGALADMWAACGCSSPVLALDTPAGGGDGQVVVTVEPVPDDEDRLAELVEWLAQHHGWRARWNTAQDMQSRLVVEGCAGGRPPTCGPLLAPVLAHGQGGRTLRFLPLARWQSLGIYGAAATPSLHALLTGLLYTHSPDTLALALLDGGQISPLYRGVAHLAVPAGDLGAVVASLAQVLRSGKWQKPVRTLLLAVVEPNEAQLAVLTELAQTLRQHPGAPLHLIVAQERLHPAGRELYAVLPALITGGGQGPASLLSGQGAWPAHGEARLAGRGVRLSGRARGVDDAEAAALIAQLRAPAADLPPVIWDAPPSEPAEGAGAPGGLPVDATSPGADAQPESDEMGTPADAPENASPAAGDGGWLRALLERDQHPAAHDAAAAPPPPPGAPAAPGSTPAARAAGWPDGPAPLTSGDLAALMAQALTAPAIVAGQDDQRGLSKRRLADLLPLPQAQARAAADVLLVWFDQAGILGAPRLPGRLHHPRPLRVTELDALATRLRATPLPDEEAVRAAWAASAQEAGVR